MKRSTCALLTTACLVANAAAPLRAQTFESRAQTALEAIRNGRTNHPKPGMYTAIARMGLGDESGGLTLADNMFRNPGDAAMFLVMNGGYFMARYTDKMSAAQRENARRFLQRDDFISSDGNWWNKGTTENHRIMFASGHYLTAQEYPSWHRRDFVIEGTTRYMRTQGEWFFKYGVKEHDSPVYQTCHLNSWLSVATLAQDPQIKRLATVVAEVYLMDWAHEWLKGCWVASSLRAYSDLNLDHANLAAGTGYLYFGATRVADFDHGYAALSATSDYRLPEVIYKIATDRTTPYVYRSSDDQIPVKPGNHISEGTRVNYPAGFRKYTYMDRDYGVYSQYDGNGTLGWSEQMLRWGVKWVGGHFTLKTRSGLGENPTSQVLQHEGVVVGVATAAMYRLERGIARTISAGGWEFLDGGPVYIAYHNVNNNRGWVVETVDATRYANLEAFRDALVGGVSVNASRITNTDPSLTYTSLNGDVLEITFDNRGSDAFGGVNTDRRKINNVVVDYSTWPRMESPWVSAQVGDPVITLSVDGVNRVYNGEDWTITETTTSTHTMRHHHLPGVRQPHRTSFSPTWYDLRGRRIGGGGLSGVHISRTGVKKAAAGGN